MQWIPLPGDDRVISPLPPSTRRGNLDIQYYNIFKGKKWSGYPIIDPVTLDSTTFMVPGDPINEIGWYEDNWPSINLMPRPRLNQWRNYKFSSGPFDFAPGDTQTVVTATYGSRGGNNLDAVAEAKRKAEAYQKLFYNNFQPAPPVPSPTLHSYSKKGEVTLWWDIEAESYEEEDVTLLGRKFPDTTYSFEGYRLWQYRDNDGTDPKIVATIDKNNGVRTIPGLVYANGTPVEVAYIFGSDKGLQRYFLITKDIYTGKTLNNGNPYYFGITAYAHSGKSSPQFVESEPSIIEVIPGREKIDFTAKHGESEYANSFQTSGDSDGYIDVRIVDPTAITGDTYEILFERYLETHGIGYTLINETKKDTLYTVRTEFGKDTLNKVVAEGFILIPMDTGLDSAKKIMHGDGRFGVKKVLEVKGPGGNEVSPPQDVADKLNSTNEWKIVSFGNKTDLKQNINWINEIGVNEYEIRFTAEGSEYYTTGYGGIRPPLNNDPKGKGRVPFEIYNIGTERDKNERMIIKIWDKELRDTAWTKNDSTNAWEYIFAHFPENEYSEPLPNSSGLVAKEISKIGFISFKGELPKEGTVVRIVPFKPFQPGDKFEFTLEKPNTSDTEAGKNKIDEISVFPNPYYGSSGIERSGQSFVRFTGLPTDTAIRIYTIAGVFIRRIDKSSINQYVDWDLRNENGVNVASGIYIAHLDMPGIGEKILKVAVVMGKEYLNR